MIPILMAKEYWMDSQFSIARLYPVIKINGHNYCVVNKEGNDLMACSCEAARAGRDMAIEADEPADLIDMRYIPAYCAMGRDAFIKMIIENEQISPDMAMAIAFKYKKEKETNMSPK